MGIIRYDAYTRFYELGESELLRHVRLPHRVIGERFGIAIPRRVMHMEFTSAPVLDERLEVRVYISHVGTTSMTLNFDIYGEGGALRSLGYLVLVCVETGGGATQITKRAWPEEFIRLLGDYQMSVEEAR